jgi:hypothetical protein
MHGRISIRTAIGAIKGTAKHQSKQEDSTGSRTGFHRKISPNGLICGPRNCSRLFEKSFGAGSRTGEGPLVPDLVRALQRRTASQATQIKMSASARKRTFNCFGSFNDRGTARRDGLPFADWLTEGCPGRRAPAGPDAIRWRCRRAASPRRRRWWRRSRRPVAAAGVRRPEGRSEPWADADAVCRNR